MFALKIIVLVAGLASTGLGLLFHYVPADNSDATALSQFVSIPFLVVGAILVTVSLLALAL